LTTTATSTTAPTIQWRSILTDAHSDHQAFAGLCSKPIALNFETEGIFATGAELKNCFCLGKGKLAIMSQHIGDLKNLETFSFFSESAARFSELFRFEPQLIATDLHPDYLTAGWSRKQGLPIEYVQHHHAHIASCMAEHGLDEKVIGLSFDGTGYGTDGHIWGSEIMLCDLAGFERLGHFEYLPMPGGDKAVSEPWRMALACLHTVYGRNIPNAALLHFGFLNPQDYEMILAALEKNINITLTSGIGRLFDAAASLLGLCQNQLLKPKAQCDLKPAQPQKSAIITQQLLTGMVLSG
jgi:hydrogenase maturation protein HypF